MLCHFQIKAALRNQPLPISTARLVQECQRYDDVNRKHAVLERSVKEHFLAIHFKRHPKKTYEGEVLDINKDDTALVQLCDLGLERHARFNGQIGIGKKYMWQPQIDDMRGIISWEQVSSD